MKSLRAIASRLEGRVFLYGPGALQYWLKRSLPPRTGLLCDAGLVELSALDENMTFPGDDDFDGLLEVEETCYTFRTIEGNVETDFRGDSRLTRLQQFYYDIKKNVFIDPEGLYEVIRKQTPLETVLHGWSDVLAAAEYMALFDTKTKFTIRDKSSLEPGSQRLYLENILSGKNASKGLSFLEKTGFIRRFWPELTAMKATEQAKEYHPEGNVWQHTLETLKFRKTRDLTLSLALLLHDIGKPLAETEGSNRFHNHSRTGLSEARRFLRHLGYLEEMIEDVLFLIRNHMLPSYMTKLPPGRIEHTLLDKRFPLVLETFRCDISSTWRDVEPYYAACRYYRKFLRQKGNPFRDSNGKKRLKLYVE